MWRPPPAVSASLLLELGQVESAQQCLGRAIFLQPEQAGLRIRILSYPDPDSIGSVDPDPEPIRIGIQPKMLDPDPSYPDRILIRSGQWIRIQEGKNDQQN